MNHMGDQEIHSVSGKVGISVLTMSSLAFFSLLNVNKRKKASK